MSKQYPGGLITKTPVVPSGPYSNSTASGIWTLEQQAYWQKLGQWPNANNPPPDAQFNYVTMLLHGDGTNGAQNNTFLDSSTNNFTITRNGNTTQGSFSPYGSNWSNYFDGSGTWLTVPDNPAWAFGSGDFTVEFWYYPVSNTTTDIEFIGQWTSGSTDESWSIGHHWTFGLIFFWTTDGSTDQYIGGTSTSLLTLNAWNHVAVSKSGTTVSLYLNGVRTNTGTLTGSISDSSRVLDIGGRSQSGANQIQGYLSNVRVVKGTAVYNPSSSTLTIPTSPLTAISGTGLLTCQSNRFADSSTNNFTVTINGAPNVQRFNPFGASTAYSTSVIGGSGYFDGAGDSLTVGNPSVNAELALGANDFTIQAWVYPLGTGTYSIISSLNNSTGNGSYWFMVNGTYLGGGTIQFGYNFVFGGSGGTDILLGTGTLKVGAWSFVAITRSGADVRGYVNGVQVGATNTSIGSRTIYPTNATELIGKNTDSDAFAMYGYLSNVELVNGTALYTGSTMTVPTAPSTPVANTELLTYFTNGAIYDNAMMNNLETVGNAQISTSVYKYGTGSLAFDGTGDSLLSTGTQNAVFGTGDFTIEMWLNPNTTSPTYQGIIDSRPAGGASANAFLIYIAGGGTLYYFSNSTNILSYSPISTSTWIHVAVTRSSSSLRLFINGTISGSAVSNTTNLSETRIIVGNTQDGFSLNGYIDDLRITKGYARYTTTFTPPTAAFPNTGPT